MASAPLGTPRAHETRPRHGEVAPMSPENPARKVKEAASEVVGAVAQKLGPHRVPGVPAPVPPPLEEPTAPVDPLPRKDEQDAPETRSATGAETGAPANARAQQDAYLTTATGTRLHDTDHSLKAGERGP